MNNSIIEIWETDTKNLTEMVTTLSSSIDENTPIFFKFNYISNHLEKYVCDVVTFHLKNKGDLFSPEKHYVEMSILNENKLGFEYDKKKKKHPLFTIIVFLDEYLPPFYFTSVDFESYKYKENFDDNNNNIFISKSIKNSHVVFDGSNYYGILSNSHTFGKYMKINVWTEKPSYHNYYINSEDNLLLTSDVQFEKLNGVIYETINDKDELFDGILYNDIDKKPFDQIISITEKTSAFINYINISIKKETVIDLSSLIINHGQIAKDILPFFNNEVYFNNTNRFSRNKMLNNTLANYLCYWIINESEKKTSWKQSVYKNYKNSLSIEFVPPVLNFVLFISNYWLGEIRTLYDIGNSIHLNIRDIFVSKYNNTEQDKVDNTMNDNDNSFLIINIQLSQKTDYIGGDILFDDGDFISLNQGDMLIHSGKKKRTSGDVTNGEKYILVMIIDILM